LILGLKAVLRDADCWFLKRRKKKMQKVLALKTAI
jgi:hypothetical protein